MGRYHTGTFPAVKPPRKVYMDVLRVIATVFVICVHTVALAKTTAAPGTLLFRVLEVFNYTFLSCNLFFVMISGAIFLNPARTVTIKKAWGKYAARIFRVLLVWGFFYYAVFQAPGQPLNGSYFYQFIIKFFSGDLYFHLWFLYMIFMRASSEFFIQVTFHKHLVNILICIPFARLVNSVSSFTQSQCYSIIL